MTQTLHIIIIIIIVWLALSYRLCHWEVIP